MTRSACLRALPLLAALAIACAGGGKEDEATVAYMAFGEYDTPEDSLPRVRYFEDGQLSLNDRCAVRKVKLNPRVTPVWVNGHPVGFC